MGGVQALQLGCDGATAGLAFVLGAFVAIDVLLAGGRLVAVAATRLPLLPLLPLPCAMIGREKENATRCRQQSHCRDAKGGDEMTGKRFHVVRPL